MRKRVAELIDAKVSAVDDAVQKTGITVESLLAEVDHVMKLALDAGQTQVALAAIKEKGILSGKRIERSEQGQAGAYADLEAMSLDELRRIAYAEPGANDDDEAIEELPEANVA
jgi:hypothetical protein